MATATTWAQGEKLGHKKNTRKCLRLDKLDVSHESALFVHLSPTARVRGTCESSLPLGTSWRIYCAKKTLDTSLHTYGIFTKKTKGVCVDYITQTGSDMRNYTRILTTTWRGPFDVFAWIKALWHQTVATDSKHELVTRDAGTCLIVPGPATSSHHR